MIRRMTLVRKAAHLTDEEFRARWIQHSDLGRQVKVVIGYRLNPIVVKPPGCDWDGVAEFWFESIDAAEAAFSEEPIASAVRKDAASFLAAAVAFFVEENVVIPPPSA